MCQIERCIALKASSNQNLQLNTFGKIEQRWKHLNGVYSNGNIREKHILKEFEDLKQSQPLGYQILQGKWFFLYQLQ